jgi:hypothetical protein
MFTWKTKEDYMDLVQQAEPGVHRRRSQMTFKYSIGVVEDSMPK